MKRILLFLFIVFSLSQAKASDTLTIRQIYNFNVGDTFDYSIALNLEFLNSIDPAPWFSGSNYERYVIIAKDSSNNNDTVTYTRLQLYPHSNQIDYLQYFNLDSPVWLAFDTLIDTPYFSIYISSIPDGRITNTLSYNNLNTSVSDYSEFGQGLGVIDTIIPIFYDEINPDEEILDEYYERTLIYYSKGADQYGTPYYIANRSALPHFTPIPEECAYWNYLFSYQDFQNTGQIRTGNKVYANSHTYVELLYRTFINNVLSADTILGYFRNDTTGRIVYYSQQPGMNESILYNFNQIDSAQIATPEFLQLSLDTVRIGGIQRTEWSYYWESPLGDVTTAVTIEGIGAEYGLFPSPGTYNNPYEGTVTFSPALQSFCVCGQTLYPDTATGQCGLLTGISSRVSSNPEICLYPNPTSDQLHLSYSDAGAYNAQFIMTDILGQEVYSSPVTQSETTHDISKLSAGMYTWRVVADNNIIKTGKVVKE